MSGPAPLFDFRHCEDAETALASFTFAIWLIISIQALHKSRGRAMVYSKPRRCFTTVPRDYCPHPVRPRRWNFPGIPPDQAFVVIVTLAGLRPGDVAVTRICPALAVDCTIARHIP